MLPAVAHAMVFVFSQLHFEGYFFLFSGGNTLLLYPYNGNKRLVYPCGGNKRLMYACKGNIYVILPFIGSSY